MKLNIAIIGSGTSGAAAALFLHKEGHHVTIFERELKPGPVGAGIMLQPTGLKMLSELGIAHKAEELGTKIHGMFGENGDKTVLDLNFKNRFNLTGLGIHRGALFGILYQALKDEKIEIVLDAEVRHIKDLANKKAIVDKRKRLFDGFDLVIVANGSSSALRANLEVEQIAIDEQQEWGALWTKIPCPNDFFEGKIQQFYEGRQKLLGLMPIGKSSKDSEEFVNFFWSIRIDRVEELRKKGIVAFREEAKELIPEKYHFLIDKIELEKMVVAPYYDVVLKPSYKNKVIFIGDAAHAMSPQLSQGTSFALLDAKILATILTNNGFNMETSFRKYHKIRSKQVYFYQNVSRIVTPMFQSDIKKTWFRDHIFYMICKNRFTRKMMVSTALGYRESLFKNLEKKYYKINH